MIIKKESEPMILLLLGTSGVGKTSVLEYLKDKYLFDSAKKYTTRKKRENISDEKNFIFCNTIDEFPSDDLLIFQSYGHAFGISLKEIKISIMNKRKHVVTIGDTKTAIELKKIFPQYVKVVMLYCDYDVLKSRITSNNERALRWKEIENEIHEIYFWLGDVDYILDCSRQFDETKTKIDRLLDLINLNLQFERRNEIE